jgi:hypothetical protein
MFCAGTCSTKHNDRGGQVCGIKHFRCGQVWHQTFQEWTSVTSDISGVDKCMASNISGVEKCGIKHFRGGQIDISGWTSVASNISGVDKCVASDISGVDKCGIRHFNL